MANIPTITAPDVYSPIARTGELLGQAFANTGAAIDQYNEIERLKKDNATRLKLRDEIIAKYSLRPDDISEKTSFDELSRYAWQLQVADDDWKMANDIKAAAPEDRQKIRMAALSDKDFFEKMHSSLQDSITKTKEEKAKQTQKDMDAQKINAEQTQAAGQLQNASEVLARGNFDVPTVSQPKREISESDYMQRLGKETSRETAAQEFQKAVPNLEKAGKENIDMALKGFRTQNEMDEATAKKRSGGAGGNERMQAEKLIYQYKKAASDAEREIQRIKMEKNKLKKGTKIDEAGMKVSVSYEDIKADDEALNEQIKKQQDIVEENRNEAERIGDEYGIGVVFKKTPEVAMGESGDVVNPVQSFYNQKAQQKGWPSWGSLSPVKQQEFTNLYNSQKK